MQRIGNPQPDELVEEVDVQPEVVTCKLVLPEAPHWLYSVVKAMPLLQTLHPAQDLTILKLVWLEQIAAKASDVGVDQPLSHKELYWDWAHTCWK
jgi:hypothetical protein